MPRMYRSSAAVKTAIGGRASSEAVPGAAKLGALLEKVKAPNASSMEGITRLTVDCVNLHRRGIMVEKTSRAWILAAGVVAGFAFGSGWTFAPKKHPVKEKRMQ